MIEKRMNQTGAFSPVLSLVVLGLVSFLIISSTPFSFKNQLFNTLYNKPKAQAQASQAVDISNYSFSPATITVNVGDIVVWTNNDSVGHTVSSDTSLFDSGIMNQGDTYSHQFDTEGSFAYHCGPHPNMIATVVVLPNASPTPTPTPTSVPTSTSLPTSTPMPIATLSPTPTSTPLLELWQLPARLRNLCHQLSVLHLWQALEI